MKREQKEILKIVVIGLAVMLVIPGAYRIWLYFHPERQTHRPSILERLSASAVKAEDRTDRMVRLMMTPPAEWTESERAAEQTIWQWLEKQAAETLPWHWLDSARCADLEGFKRAWRQVFEARLADLRRREEDEGRRQERLKLEVETAEQIYVHQTNQVAQAEAFVRVHGFPATVRFEHWVKGRLWGMNLRGRTVECREPADFYGDGERCGALQEEQAESRRLGLCLTDAQADLRGCGERLRAVAAAREKVAETLREIDAATAATALDDRSLVRRLWQSLEAEGLPEN